MEELVVSKKKIKKFQGKVDIEVLFFLFIYFIVSYLSSFFRLVLMNILMNFEKRGSSMISFYKIISTNY